METITRDTLSLNSQARDKQSAIREAGALLVKAGYIEPGYIASLEKREAVANTFLGTGVAIPHGMVDDRHLIKHTGVAVLQLRKPIQWNDGQDVHLVVAIAAQSDEHIEMLRRLTRLMQQPGAIDAIVNTNDPQAVIGALSGNAVAAVPEPTETPPWPADATVEWTLDYPNGLHARPATRWMETARRFTSEIRIWRDREFADAKALTSLLALGARHGSALRIAARGADARSAVDTLAEVARSLSAEEKEAAERARANALAARRVQPLWKPEGAETPVIGLAASPGLAIGKLVMHRKDALKIEDAPGDVVLDGEAIERALLAVRNELKELETDAAKRLGKAEAEIFAAHQELLNDPALVRDAFTGVMRGHGAAWSWQRAVNVQSDKLSQLGDATLAARALDLRDIGEQVLMKLLGVARTRQTLTEPSILVAEDLTPSDTLHLDTRMIAGLAIASGGPTSHTAILARTLGLPAIVGAGPGVLQVEAGGQAVIDGSTGYLHTKLDAADLARAQAAVAKQREETEKLRAQRYEPALTRDGHRVEIAANITSAKQAAAAVEAGAEGVGLMRTEFLFLERDTAPDEDEQFAVYRDSIAALGGRPLIIRTLDIGGDKQVPYLALPHEENPFLGVRGARLLLQRQDLLYTQLRAIYRAAAGGPVKIMFPMVTHVGEVEALREHCERARHQVNGPKLPIGIMVEVPAVAVMADRFAPVVDFFSIGTNDLTQYVLAIDRQHPELAVQADSLHPAVLALIDATVRASKPHGTWVGVCGGLAGDPLGAKILTGIGVDELSMSAQDISGVKAALRNETLFAMKELARRALAARNADEVRAL
jgi:phosphocarrier protein FPr